MGAQGRPKMDASLADYKFSRVTVFSGVKAWAKLSVLAIGKERVRSYSFRCMVES